MAQPAVFIDRDGTLIEDADYLSSPEEIRILPGAIPGLRKLHQAGYLLVIVTNQSGIARGLLSEDDLALIHEHLINQVETLGGTIDAIYYCPHHPTEGDPPYRQECDCRKPQPGLLYRARDELGLDLSASYLIGDAWRDVEASLAAGVPPIRVPRPSGREEDDRSDLFVLANVANLNEAADVILASDASLVQERMRLFDRKAARKGSRKARKRSASAGDDTPLQRNPLLDGIAGGSEVEKPKPEDESPELAAQEAPDEDAFDALPANPQPAGTADKQPPAKKPAKQQPAQDEDDEQGQGSDCREDGEQGEDGEQEADGSITEPCARCGFEIPEDDLLSGRARRVQGTLFCQECLPSASRGGAGGRSSASGAAVSGSNRSAARGSAGGGPVGGAEETLAEILTELKRLRRRQDTNGFSFTQTIGYIMQIVAIGLGILAPFANEATRMLIMMLAAILVQLIALTMFVLSRE